MKRLLVVASFVLGACHTPPSPTAPADLILEDGVLVAPDGRADQARSIAIAGDRIVAVGSIQDVEPWIGVGTRVIDLHGATVLPGLVDAHCHLAGLGAALEAVSLRDVPSESEAARIAADAAKHRDDDEWLIGRGWDQNRWPGQQFPTRASLDAVLGDRPVALRRVDGHAVWVNSRALALAGIDRATPDPAGGQILRDATGEPTGVLVDNAMELVEARIPAPTPDVIERRILAAAAVAVAAGLTGVHEMGIDEPTIAAYRRLAAAHRLPLRVTGYLSGDPTVAHGLRSRKPEPDRGFDYFSLRGVKIYADGALGSRGAALRADYSDAPGQRGNWVTSPADLDAAINDAVAGGWQVAVHAIGDAAIGAVLDAYEHAIASHPGDLRLRIEHVQVIAPADVPRMARARILASMQPTHATSDMPWAEARLGPERVRGAYAWRTLRDAGVRLVGGSDFPVEEVSPLLGLYAAVTRQDLEGHPPGGWFPEQRLTLAEALAMFTADAAYAGFVEGTRGRIGLGMAADLTVLGTPLSPDISLVDNPVVLTIVGGRVVHEAAPSRSASPRLPR